MKILIPHSLLDYFREVAIRSRIEECGLLVGKKEEDVIKIFSLFKGVNIENSSIRFTLDPETIISAHDYSDMYGFDVWGVIHSHPASPRPSSVDVKGMSNWNIPWVIIDSRNGDVGVWIYVDGEIKPIEYIIM